MLNPKYKPFEVFNLKIAAYEGLLKYENAIELYEELISILSNKVDRDPT